MKKFSSILMSAAVAAAALISCNKEVEAPVADEGIGSPIAVTLVANEVTKTYLEGLTPRWKDTDAVGVFTGKDETNQKFTNTSASGAAATFKGTVPAAGTYYAYYPYSTGTPNEKGAYVQIPSDQHPTPTSFDGAADILVSQSFTISSTAESSVNVKFRRLGSFLKLDLIDGTSGAKLINQYVTKVSVIVDNGDFRPCPSVRVTPDGLGVRGAGMKTVNVVYDDNVYKFGEDGNYVFIGILPQTFSPGSTFDITVKAGKFTLKKTVQVNSDIELGGGQILPIKILFTDEDIPAPSVQIETVWSKFSDGSTAWNEYYGGTGGTDRNVALDDNYVYVAENTATPKLWAISRTDASDVKEVNVEGVTGGVHALACPRILPNTDPEINGGEDVLICSDLTRGGEEPKLYLWVDGIDNPPHAMELTTWATGNWYGDTFTVYGTLQDGILFFDKTDGSSNGVVTFDFSGKVGAKNSLHKRIAFPAVIGHDGVCAYYPFPEDPTEGIYSPGRLVEARGKSVLIDGDLKSEGNSAFTPTLTGLEYADGRNGFVLGYNFIEWEGKRYVIYGKQPSNIEGYAYVLEGNSTDSWLDIANNANVKFRRDIVRPEGCTLYSANSGMDVAARVIDGDLYFVVQKQNIACALYRLYYDY